MFENYKCVSFINQEEFKKQIKYLNIYIRKDRNNFVVEDNIVYFINNNDNKKYEIISVSSDVVINVYDIVLEP